MRRRALIVAWLLITIPAHAALSVNVQWEVRTGGNDANGGAFDASVGSPGTDFSQQDAAQVAFTDLVIGGTTTQLTSVLNPFGSTYPGNTINITGGAGCTTGRYTVNSVSGITATMDRSVGTAASTCTGNLGGGLLTLATAAAAAVDQNTIWVQSGTYTLTATVTLQVGGIQQRWIGYQTTHGDRTGTRPLVTTATNSTPLWTTGDGRYQWANFQMTNTAGVRSSGILSAANYSMIQVQDSIFSGFTIAIYGDGGGGGNSLGLSLANVEIGNGTDGVRGTYTGVHCFACYLHDLTDYGLVVNLANNSGSVVNSVLYKVGGYALFAQGSGAWNVANSFFHTTGTTLAGGPYPALAVFNGNRSAVVSNSIFYGGSGTGGNHYLGAGGCASNCISYAVGRANAADSVGMGGGIYYTSSGDVTLTADPATNAAAGNFTLNNTAGGGAVARAAGFPGNIIGTTGTATIDIGPLQTGGGGGGQKSCVSLR